MQKDLIIVRFFAESVNESFARVAVCAYAARLNPTVRELEDIRMAASEAVTNAIIHGYEQRKDALVELEMWTEEENTLAVSIRDFGVGIENVSKAMEPFYTSKPELERSGMGFTVMCSFMDELCVDSKVGLGTCVRMFKKIRGEGYDLKDEKNLKKVLRNA